MQVDDREQTISRLLAALDARSDLRAQRSVSALRLFNGFYEGCPDLVVDQYAHTLVLFGYSKDARRNDQLLAHVETVLLERLDSVNCIVQKNRAGPDHKARRGRLSYGGPAAKHVDEFSIRYALDLTMNQDASFYLDTRNLRRWLLEKAAGWRVLNMFAYTGSLGIAALAGAAQQVIQVDRSRKYLSLARQSGMLNRLDIGKMKLIADDFFSQAAAFKRKGTLFDCVIVDPPLFAATGKGKVDLAADSMRVINKVRPLVRDGGYLIAVNNALFLSGEAYARSLERLFQDGYLSLETRIDVPQDVTGYPDTILTPPPSDPAPYNHPTKITVLRVRRK